MDIGVFLPQTGQGAMAASIPDAASFLRGLIFPPFLAAFSGSLIYD
jgi:hypothetical protein